MTGRRIENAEGIFFELADSGNGMVYKDEDAFYNHRDRICYIPEAASMNYEGWVIPATDKLCFTYNELLRLCEGNTVLCQNLFDALDWCCPQTILNEWSGKENDEY